MWNDSNLQQVIGRAARYKSHAGLPESERHAYIYKLYMKKPPINWFSGVRKWKDKIPSADMLMYRFVQKKTKELKQFLGMLEALSIEQNTCKI